MAGCCDPRGCEDAFGKGFARRMAKRYRRRGLDVAATQMVDFLSQGGLSGSTVLEIGGGVGEISIELLRRGAASVTIAELSSAYDEEARRIAEKAGVADRVERRIVDVAMTPEAVDKADLVVLHRVVCCYPDFAQLLGAAAGRCESRLAFTHPPRNLGIRTVVGMENAVLALARKEFRAFAHPPQAMIEVLSARGLSPVFAHHGRVWQAEGLVR